jgi:hypothetical protein
MTEQNNAAAERSAHVTRGTGRSIPGENFLVETSPGVFQLKAVVEAKRQAAELYQALHTAVMVLEMEGMSAGDFRAVLKRNRDAQG